MVQFYEGPIGRKDTKHPTEKYSWMIEPLIKNHSKPGDVVLDAFAGSATTLVVAKKHARNAIGFERDERFFQMAKTRIEAEQLELGFAQPGQLPTHAKPYASGTTDLAHLVLA